MSTDNTRRPPGAASDVIVVGAGSAGCVMAERLSRDGNRSVLLLEAGGPRWPESADLSLGRLPIDQGSPLAVSYPEVAGLPVVRGRGWGGSSVVNGGYFLRWHRDDFAAWPDGWSADDTEVAYTRAEDAMAVRRFPDGELPDIAQACERYWARDYPVTANDQRWSMFGVNRVWSNSADGRKVDAASAYLGDAALRPNLELRPNTPVERLLTEGMRVTGVRCGDIDLYAGEIILCAGTLGTAGILLRTGATQVTPQPHLNIGEHRELLIRYRRRAPAAAHPLLTTTLHRPDGIEVRCYSDDFARYVAGVMPTGPAIGISAMICGGARVLRLHHTGAVQVALEAPNLEATAAVHAASAEAIEMLGAADLADIVETDSVRVDEHYGTSQHAWGSMPMGKRTDWLGAVEDVAGLRIVDGSILPSGGHSGPHATIMMIATRIADVLAG